MFSYSNENSMEQYKTRLNEYNNFENNFQPYDIINNNPIFRVEFFPNREEFDWIVPDVGNNEPNEFDIKFEFPKIESKKVKEEKINTKSQIQLNMIPLNDEKIEPKKLSSLSTALEKEIVSKNLFSENIEKEIEHKNKKKKRGRRPKGNINENEDNITVHTKSSFDNIFSKFKIHFLKCLRELINFKLKNSENEDLKNLKFLKIDTSLIKKGKRDENRKLFEMDLEEILSYKLSERFKKSSNTNEITIRKIKNQNDETFNVIFKTKLGEALDIFIGKKTDKAMYFEGLKTIDDDIKTFNESESYVSTYIEQVKKYKELLDKKNPRNNRKKKAQLK